MEGLGEHHPVFSSGRGDGMRGRIRAQRGLSGGTGIQKEKGGLGKHGKEKREGSKQKGGGGKERVLRACFSRSAKIISGSIEKKKSTRKAEE